MVALFIHLIFVCALYRYSISTRRKSSHFQFSEVITHLPCFLYTLISDFSVFFSPYLSGTQFLIFLFRTLGAQVESDVSCIIDPHLVSIGDHVRLHRNAYIQIRHISISIIVTLLFTVSHIRMTSTQTCTRYCERIKCAHE